MKLYKALITGDNRGLGKALAEKFKAEGHEIMEHGGREKYDLSSNEDVYKLATRARMEGVNLFINNAAIVCPNIPFTQYSISQINDMVRVNLLAPILLHRLLDQTIERVININSMVGLEVKSPRTLYSATKWGLRGFSNSLKKEWGENVILDVYPTNVKTTPERDNAMELEFVVNEIYKAFEEEKTELVLDGRKM